MMRVRDRKTGKVYASIKEAARATGLHPSTISRYLHIGGVGWSYVDEDLRRRDCAYYEKSKCKALDALYCKSEGDQCWRYAK